jgi:hypothetical protein
MRQRTTTDPVSPRRVHTSAAALDEDAAAAATPMRSLPGSDERGSRSPRGGAVLAAQMDDDQQS